MVLERRICLQKPPINWLVIPIENNVDDAIPFIHGVKQRAVSFLAKPQGGGGLHPLGDIQVGSKGMQRPAVRIFLEFPPALDPTLLPIVAPHPVVHLSNVSFTDELIQREADARTVFRNHMVQQQRLIIWIIRGCPPARRGVTHDLQKIGGGAHRPADQVHFHESQTGGCRGITQPPFALPHGSLGLFPLRDIPDIALNDGTAIFLIKVGHHFHLLGGTITVTQKQVLVADLILPFHLPEQFLVLRLGLQQSDLEQFTAYQIFVGQTQQFAHVGIGLRNLPRPGIEDQHAIPRGFK